MAARAAAPGDIREQLTARPCGQVSGSGTRTGAGIRPDLPTRSAPKVEAVIRLADVHHRQQLELPDCDQVAGVVRVVGDLAVGGPLADIEHEHATLDLAVVEGRVGQFLPQVIE